MRRDEALSLLLSHAGELRAAGVEQLSMFGSAARDEMTADSDVDLVLAGPADRPMTLLGMARAQSLLERILRRRVDLTARQGLDNAPNFRRRISPDLVEIF